MRNYTIYLIKKSLKTFLYFIIRLQEGIDKKSGGVISSNINLNDFVEKSNLAINISVRDTLQEIISFKEVEKINRMLQIYCPETTSKTISDANKVCNHIINIFGKDYSFGKEINWHKDLISGYEWPRKYYRSIDIINLLDNSDIKFPWELNRFYFALTLGKAYWYTKDEKYAEKFISLVNAWIEENPVNKGINWNCSMEIAIRSVNLIWGYCFFIESQAMSSEFQSKFFNLILSHGKHIYRNLENKGTIKNNHYLANLAGLIYIAEIFSVFKVSKKWKAFALKELQKEINLQFFDDGSNFEGSIPYHRFSTEIIFHSILIVLKFSGISDSNNSQLTYKKKGEQVFGVHIIKSLERMFEFILAYTKPDGMAPQIGDNDSGKFINIGNINNDTNNHLYMLSIAGEFFDRDDFRLAGRKYIEDAIWLFKDSGKFNIDSEVKTESSFYRDFGVCIMKANKDYLIVRCGKLGTNGKGTHNHNDNLSFELCSNSITYFVDPGTYTYSRDPRIRNIFRSTKYHNTVCIDGVEQNTFSDIDLFQLYKNSDAKIVVWDAQPRDNQFAGEITYNINNNRIIHRREIYYTDNQYWKIKDIIAGTGDHEIIWNFHLNNKIKVEIGTNLACLIFDDDHALNLRFDVKRKLDINITEGWYSPAYENKNKSSILNLSMRVQLPTELNIYIEKCKN